MSDLLLVHGSCHRALHWSHLIPHLEALGHHVRAIDLPGMGADTTPLSEVTLHGYADKILAALEGPTVLIGHSAAGYPITLAAALAPEKISHLAYVCAYVPEVGKSLAEMRRSAPRQPLVEAIRMTGDRLSFTVDPAMAADKFFGDVPEDLARWAIEHLAPQPVKPQETPFPEPIPVGVPRSYVRCRLDNAVPYEIQCTMTESWPTGTVVDMATSHSPFLSQPKELALTLSRLIAAGGAES